MEWSGEITRQGPSLDSRQAVRPLAPDAVQAAGGGGDEVAVLERAGDLAADADALKAARAVDAVAALVGVVGARVDDADSVQAAAQGVGDRDRGRVDRVGVA